MLRILFGLFSILLITGESASIQIPEADSPSRRHIVEIRDFGFHPRRIHASPGDAVVWINRDIVPHTATASDGSWGSQELGEGESWEMVVKQVGMLNYFCEFHPHMEGVLETREGIDWRARRERVTENPRGETVQLPASIPAIKQLGLVSVAQIMLGANTIGSMAIYDDSEDAWRTDYVGLYDAVGSSWSTTWIDEMSTPRTAMGGELLYTRDLVLEERLVVVPR